ncbi:MAG TPA: hypothetical protein VHF07_01170, partial [Nitrospiraceae bacterium]|nr:hypothetical protein [Nitrospiraceae bacterium]
PYRMTRNQQARPRLLLGSACMFALATAAPVWGTEPPAQSTGPGVTQEEDASMATKRGGNTGRTTGRNEHSGSATGAARNPSKAEPESDKNRGSSQMGSDSSHEATQHEGRGQSGARTDK